MKTIKLNNGSLECATCIPNWLPKNPHQMSIIVFFSNETMFVIRDFDFECDWRQLDMRFVNHQVRGKIHVRVKSLEFWNDVQQSHLHGIEIGPVIRIIRGITSSNRNTVKTNGYTIKPPPACHSVRSHSESMDKNRKPKNVALHKPVGYWIELYCAPNAEHKNNVCKLCSIIPEYVLFSPIFLMKTISCVCFFSTFFFNSGFFSSFWSKRIANNIHTYLHVSSTLQTYI